MLPLPLRCWLPALGGALDLRLLYLHLLLAAAFVEQRLGKSKQLRADLEIDVFVLFMCFHLHLI